MTTEQNRLDFTLHGEKWRLDAVILCSTERTGDYCITHRSTGVTAFIRGADMNEAMKNTRAHLDKLYARNFNKLLLYVYKNLP